MVAASWRKFKNLQVFDFGTGKLIKDTPPKFNQTMVSISNINKSKFPANFCDMALYSYIFFYRIKFSGVIMFFFHL